MGDKNSWSAERAKISSREVVVSSFLEYFSFYLISLCFADVASKRVFQERIARAHGSQCGFCTPGIVMSMYALLRNNPTPKMADVEEAFHGSPPWQTLPPVSKWNTKKKTFFLFPFSGNLCRCTGYRPILEGFRTLTVVRPGLPATT